MIILQAISLGVAYIEILNGRVINDDQSKEIVNIDSQNSHFKHYPAMWTSNIYIYIYMYEKCFKNLSPNLKWIKYESVA